METMMNERSQTTRHEQEGAKLQSKAQEAMDKTYQAGEAGMDAVGGSLREGADTVRHIARKSSEALGETMDAGRKAQADMVRGLDASGNQLRHTTEEASADLRAILAVPSILTAGLRDLQRDWTAFVQQSVARAVKLEREILQSSSVPEVIDRQRDYIMLTIEDLIEQQAATLERSGKLWRSTLEPLDKRLRQLPAMAQDTARQGGRA